MIHDFRGLMTMLSLWLVLSLTACTDPFGLKAEEAKKREEQRQAVLANMTAPEILERTRTAMHKMEGTRWDSALRQQYSFPKHPQNNTKVKWDQQMSVTQHPVRLHWNGALSVSKELVRETTPVKRYMTGNEEFWFERNKWFKKEGASPEPWMTSPVHPEWVLDRMVKEAEQVQKDRKSGKMVLTLALSGKGADPFVDRQSMHRAVSLPMQGIRLKDQKMRLKIWVNSRTFRVDKLEGAVEFQFVSGRTAGKGRQEWTHVWKGEEKNITVPGKIRQTAIPLERQTAGRNHREEGRPVRSSDSTEQRK